MDKISAGFIGLGNIGTPMARRILGAGYPLVVFDVRAEQMAALAKGGAKTARSAADVATRSDVVLLSLPTSREVEQVTLGEEGVAAGARRGLIVVDLTSGDPKRTASICARLAERGVTMLDAGVSGGVYGAEAGTLGIMVGGDAQALERVRPVLQQIGSNIFHLGPSGAGHLTKALNNYLALTNFLTSLEALAVATKAGLDPAVVTDAINASGGSSWVMQKRIPNFVLKGDFSFRGGMAIDLTVKDLAAACQAARERGVPTPIADLVHELYVRFQNEMGAKTPSAGIARAYDRWAGRPIRDSGHR